MITACWTRERCDRQSHRRLGEHIDCSGIFPGLARCIGIASQRQAKPNSDRARAWTKQDPLVASACRQVVRAFDKTEARQQKTPFPGKHVRNLKHMIQITRASDPAIPRRHLEGSRQPASSRSPHLTRKRSTTPMFPPPQAIHLNALILQIRMFRFEHLIHLSCLSCA